MNITQAIELKGILLTKQKYTLSAMESLATLHDRYGKTVDSIELMDAWQTEFNQLGYKIAEIQDRIRELDVKIVV